MKRDAGAIQKYWNDRAKKDSSAQSTTMDVIGDIEAQLFVKRSLTISHFLLLMLAVETVGLQSSVLKNFP